VEQVVVVVPTKVFPVSHIQQTLAEVQDKQFVTEHKLVVLATQVGGLAVDNENPDMQFVGVKVVPLIVPLAQFVHVVGTAAQVVPLT
jgi:hypothetical protein